MRPMVPEKHSESTVQAELMEEARIADLIESNSKRARSWYIRRGFHRLAVVLSALILVPAIWVGGTDIVEMIDGPQFGPWLQHDSQLASLSEDQRNAVVWARHRSETARLDNVIAIIALGVYLLVRASGWIATGFMRDDR